MHRLTALIALCLLVVPLETMAATSRPNIQHDLSRIEQTTRQIRGLRQLHPVHAVFSSDSRFNAEVNAATARGNSESDIQIAQREMVLLGLLGKGANLHDLIYKSITGNVLGLYDPYSKTLYVRNHANDVFGPNRYAIAHEYTHALQDQHYHLLKLSPDQSTVTYRNSDAISAHHALTEGDAILTETLFIHRTYSQQDLRDLQALQSALHSPPLPKAIDREFLFPYQEKYGGTGFAEQLYLAGRMPALDAAYKRLPSSTYEIMHPSAYLAHWHPRRINLHSVSGFEAWKQVDDDVFGAFGYNLLLWQFLSRSQATGVTNGYQGDRYVFLENGDQSAMLFKSVWKSGAAALAARNGFLAALKSRYRRQRLSRSQSTTATPNGGVYLHVSSRTLVMAYGPNPAIALQLGVAHTS